MAEAVVLAQVQGCAVVGLHGESVTVEVDIAPGLPALNIVGLPDAAVSEARERVRAAIRNAGASFPQKRITVNLAPADLRKEGTGYDLPIAVGILVASGQVPASVVDATVFLGELALDGEVRHVPGALSVAAAVRQRGQRRLMLGAIDAPEAALVDDLAVVGLPMLADFIAQASGDAGFALYDRAASPPPEIPPWVRTDFSEVRGQEHVKRALEVAAAGGHNILMVGSPGAGKTLLARALPGVLPSLSNAEALDVTKVYSVSGELRAGVGLVRQRPFRAPHHTISDAGLVGGGRRLRPGEISLAHRGVLFLDEMPEFRSSALEALRQPIEDRTVTIARAHGSVTYPAEFMLVAAMNPCPCGNYGDPGATCTCSDGVVHRYQRRISGPMLDRIDLFVEVQRVEYDKLASLAPGEPSAAVRERVATAREVQAARDCGGRPCLNASMGPGQVRIYCQEKLAPEAGALLRTAMTHLSLSARAFHRVLKVARTVADLAGSERLEAVHVAEAVQYRRRGAIN